MITTRSTLRARPRLILACLLAFAVEVLQPAVRPLVHRHDGDGVRHVHAGPSSAGRVASASRAPSTAPPVAESAARSEAAGHRSAVIGAANAGGWHTHLPHPLHLAPSSAPALEPAIVAHRTETPPPSTRTEVPILARVARGPPSLSPHC